MAAKNYEICCALFNAYIAKPSKRERGCMTDDRRVITEGEILMLLDWFADKNITESIPVLCFNSLIRDGKAIEIRYIDADNTEDYQRNIMSIYECISPARCKDCKYYEVKRYNNFSSLSGCAI